MTFDYIRKIIVDGQLDVENVGQCVILGRNDLGEENYLLISTALGITNVITYGPVIPDFAVLPSAVTMTYSRFDYNQSKIEKLIDKFLNDPKKAITFAETTSFEAISSGISNSLSKIFSEENVQINE